MQETDLEAVISALPHTKLTLEELGCNRFKVVQRRTNPYIFDVDEEFINVEAFESHQLRIKGTEWERVTKNVDRHYKISKEGESFES